MPALKRKAAAQFLIASQAPILAQLLAARGVTDIDVLHHCENVHRRQEQGAKQALIRKPDSSAQQTNDRNFIVISTSLERLDVHHGYASAHLESKEPGPEHGPRER